MHFFFLMSITANSVCVMNSCVVELWFYRMNPFCEHIIIGGRYFIPSSFYLIYSPIWPCDRTHFIYMGMVLYVGSPYVGDKNMLLLSRMGFFTGRIVVTITFHLWMCSEFMVWYNFMLCSKLQLIGFGIFLFMVMVIEANILWVIKSCVQKQM